mmetsp:Transcript_33855/g.56825  ORF Transcript_33855/g.56825 Transcript_33855/m.56825 type:complete len:168 (-) Transcript_33855:420-923(-)
MIRSNRRAGVIRRTAPLALVAIVCFIFFSIMNAVNMHPKSPPAPATLIVTPHPTASSPRPTDTKSTLLTRLRDMPFETTYPNFDEMKARQPQPEAKEAKEDQCPKNTFTLPNVMWHRPIPNGCKPRLPPPRTHYNRPRLQLRPPGGICGRRGAGRYKSTGGIEGGDT